MDIRNFIVAGLLALLINGSLADSALPSSMELYASQFAGDSPLGRDIPNRALLGADGLDSSLASLKQVDTYLAYMGENKKNFNPEVIDQVIKLAAAYVGEVIILYSSAEHSWMHKKDNAGVLLVDENGKESDLSLLINKVLSDSKKHSVHYFTLLELGFR